MHNQDYAQKILRLPNSLVLHVEDWESRLGQKTFSLLQNFGGLVKPSQLDVDGKVFNYDVNRVFVNSEIQVEGDFCVINPMVDGYPVVKKKLHELNLLKYSNETEINFIRQFNNLSSPSIAIANNNKIQLVGEAKIKNCLYLILIELESGLSLDKLHDLFPSDESFKKYDRLIVLSKEINSSLSAPNVVCVKYDDFLKIPIIAFRSDSNGPGFRDIASFFRYPFAVDSIQKIIYLFGEKLGTRSDTKIYRYLHALTLSQASLPMVTETFFKMHKEISTEHFDSLIKGIRSDLKEQVAKALKSPEADEALAFLDLVAEDKERGSVNLKLRKSEIQIW